MPVPLVQQNAHQGPAPRCDKAYEPNIPPPAGNQNKQGDEINAHLLILELEDIREEVRREYRAFRLEDTPDGRMTVRGRFKTKMSAYRMLANEISRNLTPAQRKTQREDKAVLAENEAVIEKQLTEDNQARQVRNPRIKVSPAEYNGDILGYHVWRAQWDTFHNDTQYSDQERFQLLKQSLKGQAHELAKNIQFSPENYRILLTKLEIRFANMAISTIKQNMRRQSLVIISENFTATQLKDMADTIVQCRQNLNDLNERPESYQEEIMLNLMSSLPQSITSRWRRTWTVDFRPNLDVILNGLAVEINLQEREEVTRSQNARKTTTNLVRSREKTPPRLLCMFCQGTHGAFDCTEKTVEQKPKYLTEGERCYVCFTQGHFARECEKQWICRKCRSGYNTTSICTFKDRARSPTPVRARTRSSSPGSREQSEGEKSTDSPVIEQRSGSILKQREPESSRSPSAEKRVTLSLANVNLTDSAKEDKAGLIPTFSAFIQNIDGSAMKIGGMIDTASQNSWIREALR